MMVGMTATNLSVLSCTVYSVQLCRGTGRILGNSIVALCRQMSQTDVAMSRTWCGTLVTKNHYFSGAQLLKRLVQELGHLGRSADAFEVATLMTHELKRRPKYPKLSQRGICRMFLPFGLRQETQKEDEVWATDFIAADLKEAWGQSLFSLVFCACDWPTDSPTEATSFSVLYKAEFALPKCELRSWKSIGKACSTFEAMVWHLCIKIRTELEIHLDYLSLQVFWIYPIYCISFVLNTVMYQEAQSLSFVMFTCRPLQVSFAPSQKHLAVQTQKLVLHFFYLHSSILFRTASSLHRVSILCHIRHARIRSACRLRTVRFDLRSALQSLAFQS